MCKLHLWFQLTSHNVLLQRCASPLLILQHPTLCRCNMVKIGWLWRSDWLVDQLQKSLWLWVLRLSQHLFGYAASDLRMKLLLLALVQWGVALFLPVEVFGQQFRESSPLIGWESISTPAHLVSGRSRCVFSCSWEVTLVAAGRVSLLRKRRNCKMTPRSCGVWRNARWFISLKTENKFLDGSTPKYQNPKYPSPKYPEPTYPRFKRP